MYTKLHLNDAFQPPQVHAEEDPFSEELDVEQEVARLLRSGNKEDELQDLDR